MRRIDQRGAQFAAAWTLLVGLLALSTGDARWAWALAGILGLGALLGARYNLWFILYRWTLAPLLRPAGPGELEPAAPQRFATIMGFAFAAFGGLFLTLGLPLIAALFLGVLVLLAGLNAIAGICIGCMFYGRLVLRPAIRKAQREAQP